MKSAKMVIAGKKAWVSRRYNKLINKSKGMVRAGYKAAKTRALNKLDRLARKTKTTPVGMSPQQWAWHPDNPNGIRNKKK